MLRAARALLAIPTLQVQAAVVPVGVTGGILDVPADPAGGTRRVRMLWALRNAEFDVATPAAVASCRPTVARQQHLSKLRFAGLVEGQRQGQRVVCRLRGGHVRALLTEALFQPDHYVSGAPVYD